MWTVEHFWVGGAAGDGAVAVGEHVVEVVEEIVGRTIVEDGDVTAFGGAAAVDAEGGHEGGKEGEEEKERMHYFGRMER